MTRVPSGVLLAVLVSIGGSSNRICAQVGTVLHQQRISASEGNFTGPIGTRSFFGYSVAGLGDLSHNGTRELAVTNLGRTVWILSLGTDGTVVGERSITPLSNQSYSSVAGLGDVDGDGVDDLALYDVVFNGTIVVKSVDTVFLNPDGTVKSIRQIPITDPVFVPAIAEEEGFGTSMAGVGDMDGDGVVDLAIGAPNDPDGPGLRNGAIWILHLKSDGSPKSAVKISELRGGGSGILDVDGFGYSIAPLGDLDGDGNKDLLVGSPGQSYVSADAQTQSVMVLFLDATNRLKSATSIPQEEFDAFRDASGNRLNCGFARSLAVLGDVDSDGTVEFVVGEPYCLGAFFVGSLKRDGTLARRIQVAEGKGGFEGPLLRDTFFSNAAAALGDVNRDGVPDVVVAADEDDDGGNQTGALWIFALDGSPVRNGSGVNPRSLSENAQPSLGQSWQLTLDCSGHAPGVALVAGFARPHPGIATGNGEVLVDLNSTRFFRFLTAHNGTPTSFVRTIPNIPALLGLQFHVQGVCTGAPGAQFSNALDVVVGR